MAAILQTLAWAITACSAPLFLDLALSIAGNLIRLIRPGRSHTTTIRSLRMAVVVPAHNEALMIAHTVRSLLAAGCTSATEAAQEPPHSGPQFPVRIYVVAHNCTDRTVEEAARAGAVVVRLDQFQGKGAALRCGFAAARADAAEAFLVVDADTTVRPNLLEAMRQTLESGADAAQCRYELAAPEESGLQARARLRVLAFRGINVARARGRAALGLSAGLFGNGFALTASLLERLPFQADSICEDIEYNARLIAADHRVTWVEETAVYGPLSAPGTAQAAQEARWEGGRLRVARQCSLPLLGAALRSNPAALAMLAELWSLPLSRGLLLLLLAFLLPVHWLHLYAAVCLATTLAYVLESALLGRQPALELAALAAAPLHLLWKLMITPLVLRQSRRRAAWKRTRREAIQK
ncbi:glycosyltransferase family 2 protein [Telmatobacter bradus]|uniref:glycosyltransferase family 2 protein n=1 Tax=Telmatobacter bradus TaxID=474953 RepID=UPI003B429A97